jgi:hypothetical protein
MFDKKKAEMKIQFYKFSHYKLALQWAFEVVNEKWVMKQRIHILQ